MVYLWVSISPVVIKSLSKFYKHEAKEGHEAEMRVVLCNVGEMYANLLVCFVKTFVRNSF